MGSPDALLPEQAAEHRGKICLVLDLDETLVHSSFKVFIRLKLGKKQLKNIKNIIIFIFIFH